MSIWYRTAGGVKKNSRFPPSELRVRICYTPRAYQRSFEKAMDAGCKRAVLVWARRHGKDFACWNYMIWRAIQEVGTYFYIFPEYSHGKKVIWHGITEKGRRYLDQLPRELVTHLSSQDMRVTLINGSEIQIVGSANYDALRGTNPRGVVLSEYAYQNPNIWTHVLDPILSKNNGWAVFNSTPQGRNHFWDLVEYAKENAPEWFCSTVTNADTHFVSDADIAKKRAWMSEELIQQEYYCSFEAGVQGSYYGRLIQQAGAEGRIGYVPYDQNHLVYTAWDIGISDSTSIVFFQKRGNEILVIDHYENSGYPMRHYADHIKALPYKYGQHFIPHDGRNRSILTGQTYVEAGRELGMDMTVLDNSVPLLSGIERVRAVLPRVYFDKSKCDYLLRALQNYHAEYDDKAKVFRTIPKHDWSSHSADAFRIMVLSLSLASPGVGLTPEQLKEMRQKAGVVARYG